MHRRLSIALMTFASPFGLAGSVVNAEPAAQEFTVSEPTSAPVLRNRLAEEISPYLRQHEHNPVHWFAWGDEAFEVARELDRPVFLSIGYSTCYWCHVMERESFESEFIASILNEHFVCIKVDREERPDLDAIYMQATQIMNNGQGGWPMSVWLLPDTREPFLAGTYFPPEQKFQKPGFPDLLRSIDQAWKTNRSGIESQAKQVAEIVRNQGERPLTQVRLDAAMVDRSVDTLLRIFDRQHGGFGSGPSKFPTPVNLDLLMDVAWERDDVQAAVKLTLDRMRLGGLHDQVGGGFHRYSVDPTWTVPHFEKMLYDNGQLMSTYSQAFALTGDVEYERVVRRIAAWAEREMMTPQGLFFSAQDAEVDGREGLNYIWSQPQMDAALEEVEVDRAFALSITGMDAGPNFQDPHHPESDAVSVLLQPKPIEEIAEAFSMTVDMARKNRDAVYAALLPVRDRRKQARMDDKIITGWNGLMIAGYADAAIQLDDPTFAARATTAANALLALMQRPDGSLARVARGDEVRGDAFLEDYAFVIDAFLRLAEATDDSIWVGKAVRLADVASRMFRAEGGGWYDAATTSEDVFARIVSTYDGAVPSGNNAMIRALAGLGDAWEAMASEDLRAVSANLARAPAGATVAMQAVNEILAMNPTGDGAAAMILAADSPAVGTPDTTGSASPAIDTPVTVSLEPDYLVWIEEGTSETIVRLTIAPGHHVTAPQSNDAAEAVLPITIDAVPPGEKTGVFLDVDWPTPTSFNGPLGPIDVYEGTVDVRVRFTRTGEQMPPNLRVVYQVCTDEVCLAPAESVLSFRVRD